MGVFQVYVLSWILIVAVMLVLKTKKTKKREGRSVSEAVSHFVYWHDGRSCTVTAAALTDVQFLRVLLKKTPSSSEHH